MEYVDIDFTSPAKLGEGFNVGEEDEEYDGLRDHDKNLETNLPKPL